MLPLGFVVYLLTFCCYGTHLRGDEKGSVDRAREGRGGPIRPIGRRSSTMESAP